MAETYTYTLKLSIETPFSGCDSTDELTLEDYDYSDQKWDALTEREQGDLLDEWAEDNFWNSGFGFRGEVEK